MSSLRRVRTVIIALAALPFAAGAVVFAPVAAHASPTTYTFIGLDRTDPSDFGKAANWDPTGVPTDGDSIVVVGKHVTKAQAHTYASVSLSDNASLTGAETVTAGVLSVDCANVSTDVSIVALGFVRGMNFYPNDADLTLSVGPLATLRVDQPLPGLSGCTDHSTVPAGQLRLYSRTKLVNDGVVTGNGTILGMNCCTDPIHLDSSSGATISGADGLRLESLRVQNDGTFADGTTTLDGGDHVLRSGTRINGVVLADGATLRMGDATNSGSASATLGASGHLRLAGGSAVRGAGSWSGTGSIDLEGSYLYGGLTIGSQTKVVVKSGINNYGYLAGAGPSGPTMKVDGTLSLLSGTLRNDSKIEVAGTIDVPAHAAALIDGLRCCTAPVANLHLTGTMRVGAGASLGIDDTSLRLAGTTAGSGALTISGGVHEFAAGARIASNIRLTDYAEVTVTGAVTFDQGRLRNTGGATIIGSPSAAFNGTGSWNWSGGTVTNKLIVGRTVTTLIDGATRNSYGAGTGLTFNGPTTIAGTSELLLASASVVTFNGPLALRGARVGGWSCCTAPASVVMNGPVGVIAAARVSRFESVRTRFRALALSRQRLEVAGPSAQFDGAVRLQLGTLALEAPATFTAASSLESPGTVSGRPKVFGKLSVRSGAMRMPQGLVMSPTTQTTFDYPASMVVGRATQLKGRLTLLPAGMGTTWKLIAGTGLTGTFSPVVGRPASKLVRYSSAAVILR